MAAESSIVEAASKPLSKSLARAAYAFVGLAMVVLIALVVRELMPRHAAEAPKVVRHDDTGAPPVATAPLAPAPTVAKDGKGDGHGHEGTEPQAAGPKSDGLVRVRALASIISNPDSAPSTGVFHNLAANLDYYSYDVSFGPFRRGSMKRDSKNPAAWEIDGTNGPRSPPSVEDIAPAGALHQAAVVKDERGNPVSTWFSVDSGPLAPAFATLLAAGGTRVVSRAYVEEHRTQFPAELTAALDH